MAKVTVLFNNETSKTWICESVSTDDKFLTINIAKGHSISIGLTSILFFETIFDESFANEAEKIVNEYGKDKSQKIQMIKALREMTGLGLLEANNSIEKYL
jgi:ribosomal protein L7/L12